MIRPLLLVATAALTLTLTLTGCMEKEANTQDPSAINTEIKTQIKSKDDAVQIALDYLQTTTPPSIESANLITQNGKQIWEITLKSQTAPYPKTIVLIDAASGQVLDIISETLPG